MKRRLTTYVTLGVSLLAVASTSVAPSVFAATSSLRSSPNTGGQALEIAPPVMNITGNPGQVIKTQIVLRDISSGSLVVNGQVNDFTADGEDGTPKILLDPTASTPYGMKDWVSTIPSMTLKSHQIENLPVTIRIPANASPGGHYGVVRFTASAPQLNGQGVALSASLGTLILLTVNGTTTEKLTVQELSISHDGKKGTLFQSTPLNFTVRLKNEGNIHEQPSGNVMITDMFGKPVAGLAINQPPHNILPGTIRKFETPLDKTVIGSKKLFGRYHAVLTVTYGKNKQTVTSSMNFWVIPYKTIGIGIVVIIGGFFALRVLLRRYNQAIVDRAQGNTRSRSTSKKRKK